jgi:GNAT superfamily N-acetyltransferase
VIEDVIIRLAVPSERAELEALQWRASLANPGDRGVLLAHPDAIELPMEQITAGDVFVAQLRDAVVGFAALRVHAGQEQADQEQADQEIELDAMFVEPGMQRRGIGKLLLEHCIEAARRRECCALKVVANPHAMYFYRACGFSPAGTCETRFGPALSMRRAL